MMNISFSCDIAGMFDIYQMVDGLAVEMTGASVKLKKVDQLRFSVSYSITYGESTKETIEGEAIIRGIGFSLLFGRKSNTQSLIEREYELDGFKVVWEDIAWGVYAPMRST